jgi:hypothetical protein
LVLPAGCLVEKPRYLGSNPSWVNGNILTALSGGDYKYQESIDKSVFKQQEGEMF